MSNCNYPRSDIEWAEFMAKNDLYWNEINEDYYDGAFIGDGIQGTMVTSDEENSDAIRMILGRYDVIAHERIPKFEYCIPRLFAGSIIIEPINKVEKRSMRLNLWDGEASGTTKTEDGSFSRHAIAERENRTIIVEIKSDNEASLPKIFVRKERAVSPAFYLKNTDPNEYPNWLPPDPECKTIDGINLIINKLRTKGAHAVVWTLQRPEKNRVILFAAVAADANSDTAIAATNAVDDAFERVEKTLKSGFETLLEQHREWWHDYMKESFIHLPQDAVFEKFWWLQIYKFANASAEDSSLLIDNQGPWSWKCCWGAIWWNLNVQLAYFPTFSANKLKVGKSLINGIDRIYDSGAFHKNATNGVGITVGRSTLFDGRKDDTGYLEYGNLTWVLHNYWRYWKYSDDDVFGRRLFPILADNVAYLISKLEKKDDGKLHMEPSRSPEYHEKAYTFHPDTNYALMSLHWGLQTLIKMTGELEIDDSRKVIWEETLINLTDFPTDEYGFRVSALQSHEWSHRHYSHLLAIYPYHTIKPDSDDNKELMWRSIDHWQSLTDVLAGYSYAGACAMYATLGDGNKALNALDKLLEFLEPNTMYKEQGGPVTETPLSAVESLNYMLLQSWDGLINVFPAIPDRWKSITFANLRTEGGFLVSGERKSGHNIRVEVTNIHDKELIIKPNLSCSDADVRISPETLSTQSLGNGVFKIGLKGNEEVILNFSC